MSKTISKMANISFHFKICAFMHLLQLCFNFGYCKSLHPGSLIAQDAGIFDEPHVFLTISSVAGIIDGENQDTMLELNWYNFPEDAYSETNNWIGLFNYDPLTPAANDSTQLVLASVSARNTTEDEDDSSKRKGYFKTSIKFGHPQLNSSSEGDNCLGFWIAYVNGSTNEPVKANCFRKYPRWMNELESVIRHTPLHSLMIPGTHDAGAIREYDGLLSETPGVRYSVCQENQHYNQFIHGIRYVDTRVAHYPLTPEKFWINHGSTRYQPLITLFNAIDRFVEETNEIIFMDFHGFPVGMDEIENHNELLEFVQEHIGHRLVHKSMLGSNFSDVTPDHLWKLNRTVILTYQRDDVSSQHDFLWPYLIHGWGDVNLVDALEEYMDQVALPTLGCTGVFWSAMAEITPTSLDHILYPLRGLRGFAEMVNIPLSYWWHRPSWYSRSMIISMDFFLGSNIIEMAVKANRRQVVCNATKTLSY